MKNLAGGKYFGRRSDLTEETQILGILMREVEIYIIQVRSNDRIAMRLALSRP